MPLKFHFQSAMQKILSRIKKIQPEIVKQLSEEVWMNNKKLQTDHFLGLIRNHIDHFVRKDADIQNVLDNYQEEQKPDERLVEYHSSIDAATRTQKIEIYNEQ